MYPAWLNPSCSSSPPLLTDGQIIAFTILINEWTLPSLIFFSVEEIVSTTTLFVINHNTGYNAIGLLGFWG